MTDANPANMPDPQPPMQNELGQSVITQPPLSEDGEPSPKIPAQAPRTHHLTPDAPSAGKPDLPKAPPHPASGTLPKVDDEVDRELEKAMGGQSMAQFIDQAQQAAVLPARQVTPGPTADTTDAEDATQGEGDTLKPASQSGTGVKVSQPAGSSEQVDRKSPAKEAHVEFELKRGRIAAVRDEEVFVTLSGSDSKMQGIVPLKQFEMAPRPGSIMDFVVERINEEEGLIHLSREGAVSITAWDSLTKGHVIEAHVTGTNKGGLELEIAGRVKAFMPASQIDIAHVDDLEVFVSQKITAMVLEVDRKGKRVLLSRRRHLEKQREIAKRQLLESLAVGQTLTGKVSSIMAYGVFVDIGGADGLVHISDMSHAHIKSPKEMVKVGQEVQVQVLKIEEGGGRIKLGIKQIEPDPWEGAGGRYSVGEMISGRVVRTADFGAFIELQPGVEGLLPTSEMSWKRIGRASEVCKEGDVLKLAILKVDEENHKLTLSLKQAQGDPWKAVGETYPQNTLVQGTVTRITDFGAFVEIAAGLEGLVHISELSTKRVATVDEVVKVGDQKEFRVIAVSEQDRKISLSIKAVDTPVSEKAEQQRAPMKPMRNKRTGSLKGGMGKAGGLGVGLGSLKL